jgi:hypothetical protein
MKGFIYGWKLQWIYPLFLWDLWSDRQLPTLRRNLLPSFSSPLAAAPLPPRLQFLMLLRLTPIKIDVAGSSETSVTYCTASHTGSYRVRTS